MILPADIIERPEWEAMLCEAAESARGARWAILVSAAEAGLFSTGARVRLPGQDPHTLVWISTSYDADAGRHIAQFRVL